jgi:hypothetical protein
MVEKKPGAESSRPAPAYLLVVDSVRKGEKFQNRISLGSSPISLVRFSPFVGQSKKIRP